ncbi:hypothetical protein [Ottowia thiooxydans]|uniref:hypothetical protein n=1 Tax=Ottowia thiooxydans TaxID=219182 RepID=UPI00048CD9C9|nr:hypothetical protein [Ottowia thiooxydans]
MADRFEKHEISRDWADINLVPRMRLSHVSLAFIIFTLYFIAFDAQAQDRLYRCGNEYTNKIAGRTDCTVVKGGDVEIVWDKPKEKRAKRPSGEITPKDFRRLKMEAQENIIRFEENHSGKSFSAKATFSSVSARKTLPGYLVNFESEGVGIVCLLKDKSSLDFVKNLNIGDSVNIKATFQGKGFSREDYFSFGSCRLSK